MTLKRWWIVVGCLAASGCAAPRYLYIPVPPAPQVAGVDHAEGNFDGVGGVRLFEQSWKPQTAAKAVLVIVHGLKDHSSRYAEVAQKLTGHGIAVYAFDLRGHGQSEGRRVWINSFEEYLADLDRFLSQVRQREPGKPLFLMGHSMGGAIVTLYTLTRKPTLAGLVLSAPALEPGDDVSPFLISVTHGLGRVLPKLAVLKLENESFSRDPKVVQAMNEDPLVYQGAGPARTAAELLGAMGKIGEQMEEVTVPLLAMHGAADKVTNPQGSKDLVSRANSTDKTLKLYPDLVHDLLHEPEKDKVFTDLAAWLDAHAH